MRSELSLYWTQARGQGDALHAEDPLASRVLESQIAALFWPGFTRHTTQPAYYVVVCYGLLLAEEAAKRQGLVPSDDVIRTLFHRWERAWAMAVCMAKDGDLSGEHGMRGREGALAAYQAGARSLDYQLIGRRRELGALGAYLSSLRDHGLVRADRLRLTPLGWDLAQHLHGPRHDFLLDVLRPGASINKHAAAMTDVGQRMALSTLAAQKEIREKLWQRLFAKTEARFAALLEMTESVIADSEELEPRALFQKLLQNARTSAHMRDVAQLALVFGDLCTTLRTIFDRTYQTVLAGGFASDWSSCVHAAIPQGFASQLNDHINNWRRFQRAEQMMAPMACAPKFIQVVRRMNSQNAYHIFESVLFLHVQMQRIRGKGAWIDRKGEVVYLRHTGYEHFAIEGNEWAPGYRVLQMRQLIHEVRA